MANEVDSFRFVDVITRKIIQAWIARETPAPVPWTPLAKPLTECTVALVTSAAVALREDQPFDQEGERRNPWWGDPSYRRLPRDATEKDVAFYHLHTSARFAKQDLDCILPLGRLGELEAAGDVGRSAPTHYSFMGYILKPKVLIEETVPAMISEMKAESVDAALLIPF